MGNSGQVTRLDYVDTIVPKWLMQILEAEDIPGEASTELVQKARETHNTDDNLAAAVKQHAEKDARALISMANYCRSKAEEESAQRKRNLATAAWLFYESLQKLGSDWSAAVDDALYQFVQEYPALDEASVKELDHSISVIIGDFEECGGEEMVQALHNDLAMKAQERYYRDFVFLVKRGLRTGATRLDDAQTPALLDKALEACQHLERTDKGFPPPHALWFEAAKLETSANATADLWRRASCYSDAGSKWRDAREEVRAARCDTFA